MLPPFSLPSLNFSPACYRPHGIGDWSGHIPLACDVVASLRPSTFVELGTHWGESYFAFCQAIAENSLSAKAYSVDTWRGDIHTGSYGDEVFDEVYFYNTDKYRHFSQLIRRSFDDAADLFPSESIDLLHIDGVHTLEAVRHDFDTWWPKVRRGGLILLHDSCVRSYDFGVWKLIAELREASHRIVEFFHSNGLAVVLKSGELPANGIVPLLFDSDDVSLQRIRRYYEICAGQLEHAYWSARQNRPADWDVTTQLFWRSEGEDYTEVASVRAAHTTTAERSRVVLTIPELSKAPIELRLDLTHRPAFLKLHSIAASNAQGQLLWALEANLNAEQLANGGLHLLTAVDGSGALILDTPQGASFLLPISAREVAPLQTGGHLLIELSGVDMWSFASEVAVAAAHDR